MVVVLCSQSLYEERKMGGGWRRKGGWVGEGREREERGERVELEGDYDGKKVFF